MAFQNGLNTFLHSEIERTLMSRYQACVLRALPVVAAIGGIPVAVNATTHQNCTADINQSGVVDLDDFSIFLIHFGQIGVNIADINGDLVVDLADFSQLLLSWGPCQNEEAEIIFEQDFEHHQSGLYTEEMLDADWQSPTWSQGIDEGRVSIVSTDDENNHALAIQYPQGAFGTSQTGAQWKLLFDQSYESVRLTYRIQFQAPFDFVKGGKLPGLIGGEGNTGGGIPTGTDGWSARMMWRTQGNAVQYVYHPDQPNNYGEDLPWTIEDQVVQFTPGQWHEVVHEIKMNTPGQNDGHVTCWFDGVKALEAEAMRFRDIADFGIDGLYFSTFFGGSNSTWATSKDETVLFDDFHIEAILSNQRSP